MSKNIQNLIAVWDKRPRGRKIDWEDVGDLEYVANLLVAMVPAMRDIKANATTQPTQVPAAEVEIPNNVPPLPPAPGSNTHIQALTPSTAGTVEASDRKSGSEGKPSSSREKKIAALAKARVAKAAKKAQAAASSAAPAVSPAAPPAEPQPTGGNATA